MVIRTGSILLALLSFVLPSPGQTPLWKVDLEHFGYQGRPPRALADLPQNDLITHFGTEIYNQGVAIVDPSTAVAYFVTHDDPPGAPEPRVPLLSDPFRLVAVFLDVRNGEVIRKLDWPLTNSPSVASNLFAPAGQGRFLVRLGNKLDLYSPECKLITHLDLPSATSLIVSASAESLLLHTASLMDGRWTTHYELRKTGDLSLLKSWDESQTAPPHSVQSVSEDRLAWTWKSALYFKAPGAEPRQLVANQGELCGAWKFISNDELAGPVCGANPRLLTVSTQGKVGGAFDLGFEQLDGPIFPSASGHNFAVSTFRWGTGEKDPEYLTARVFGSNMERPLLTLNIAPDYQSGVNFFTDEGDTRFGWGGLALSPDGELLAVKSGATVRLYKVSATGDATDCGAACIPATEFNHSQSSSPRFTIQPRPSPQLIEQMLSWLPSDTETVAGTNGPLLLPAMVQDSHGQLSMAKSEHPVQDVFKQFQLLPLLALATNFADEPILAAIEGSRDFQPPGGLGMMKSQSGSICVFAGDITALADAFLKDPTTHIMRREKIEGHAVAVFQQKSEQDLLTTYIAFPKSNVAVVATNEDYLREILSRMDGKQGVRALPATLAEWKNVDRLARFWAIRHYRRVGAEKDQHLTSFTPPARPPTIRRLA